MTSDKILIIDEAMDQVKPDYDLLQDTSENMKNLIEIKEKKLPGKKKSFNHRANAETKEVTVTGLVLRFSQDLADSKLNSILGRNDIEHLYLYADTIFINDKLVFPQTNVTICCRYLIMDEQGFVCTTPEPHPQPYATGSGGDNRKSGARGEHAGKITLLCETVDSRHKNDEPVFILTGGKGQNSEMGETPNKTTKPGYPVSWSSIEHEVITNDAVEGKTSNWVWPDFTNIAKDKIYYADIHSTNSWWSARNPRKKDSTIGDSKVPNQDNGADAIASGPGGNGGNGGDFLIWGFNNVGKNVTCEISGGEEGVSKRIEGGKKAKDSTYYHLYLKVFHDDTNYNGNKNNKNRSLKESYTPKGYYTNTLTSRDGYPAQGANGKRGNQGVCRGVDKMHWLQPLLLETMLGYAKTNFRDGERWKAKWILDRYDAAIKTLIAGEGEDMHTASLIRETEMYLRRLDQNLDFYGYPPGWIPRLSALSSLDILIDSRRDLAQLLYFANRLLKQDEANKLEAKDLEWTVKELKKGLDAAKADIVAAFDEIPGIKDQVHALERQVADRLTELRNLKDKIIQEVRDLQKAQALFTGSFEILAAVCVMVPVGQPYLGQLGGGVMKQISKIDINSENPLMEGLSFAGNLSGEISGFVDKNKDKIKATATASLTKEIEKGTKDLNAFNTQEEKITTEMKEAENELKARFSDQQLSLLREKIRVVRGMGSSNRPLSVTNDYADIISEIDTMQSVINTMQDEAEDQKQELQTKLAKLKTDKKELSDKLKARKTEKEKREKNIETAGKTIKGFTDGISGISSGLQKMMVEFDENDPEVQAKMAAIKDSKYKKDFESINEKITGINKQKLPLIEKLMRIEQRITEGVQRINSNLVQWSVLNDQRVTTIQYGLLPETRASLKRIVQGSWDLLMLECYYMTKSYQYRFLKKINPVQHGMQKMIEDIEQFREGKDPRSMTETAYKDLFDKVLKSQFKKLAFDLLISRQTGNGKIYNEKTVPVLTASEKNAHGEIILDRLNMFGVADFRLEDIQSSKHGTDSWMHYRITGIEFDRIELKADNPNVSFAFGIRHSGDSLIRAFDKKLYYFTSRSSQKNLGPKSDNPGPKSNNNGNAEIDLQVQSWSASYNGADRELPNKGLSNSTDSTEDDKLLNKLLRDFNLTDDYEREGKPYKDHYPGGSSELTLVIYDNAEKRNFQIKELKFTVHYEVLR